MQNKTFVLRYRKYFYFFFFSIYVSRINSKDDLLISRPSFVIGEIFLLSRKRGGCRLRGKRTLALVDFNIENATAFIINSERGPGFTNGPG